MSRPPAVIFALLAILAHASCKTGGVAAGAPSEPPRRTDPPAGTVFYKGRTIVFDEAADPPLLVIDGGTIKVARVASARNVTYYTSIMTYVEYTSLWGLARALVDSHLVDKPAGH